MPIPTAATTLSLPPPTPHNHTDLISTVLSDLTPAAPTLSSLSRLGYTADPANRQQLIPFLLSSLQTHRILQSRAAAPPAPSADSRLTRALSRVAARINVPPPTTGNKTFASPHFIALLSAVNTALSQRNPPLAPLLGAPLCPSLTDAQLSNCKAIHKALQEEHNIRVDMLITRLNVTIQAFSRSSRAHAHQFTPLATRVLRMSQSARCVSMYHILVARRYVLSERVALQQLSTPVTAFVMGNVPDRGGRLQYALMPPFMGRLNVPSEGKEERGKPRSGKPWKTAKAHRKRKHK